MKHLKYFENKKFKYKVDNYIKLKQDETLKGINGLPWHVSTVCKITDFDSQTDSIDYYIETYLLTNKKIENFWVDEYEIERLATEEEIENYKTMLQANKYNL